MVRVTRVSKGISPVLKLADGTAITKIDGGDWLTSEGYPRELKSNFEAVINHNRSTTFTYNVSRGNSSSRIHVIWVINEANLSGISDTSGLRSISPIKEHLKEAGGDVEGINNALIESYISASEFYNWGKLPNVLFIGIARPLAAALEQSFFVSLRMALPLGYSADNQRLLETAKARTADALVHEFVHTYRLAIGVEYIPKEDRDGGYSLVSEFAASIPEMAFALCAADCRVVVDTVIETTKFFRGKDRLRQDYLDLGLMDRHNRAKYMALLLLAGKMAESHEEIKTLMENDPDPHKLGALREFAGLMKAEDVELLKEISFKIISMPQTELMGLFKATETGWGININVAKSLVGV